MTDRQQSMLQLIVDQYMNTGQPVSSQELLDQFNIELSSATIRNEMSALEDGGYIKKSHSSAGRIPTDKAYELYIADKKDPEGIDSLKQQLKKIFTKRNESIDTVIDEALKFISDSTNTLTVSKTETSSSNLADMKIYKIADDRAMLLLVATNGNIINTEINIDDIKYEDLEVVIAMMSERLIGEQLNDLLSIATSMKDIVQLKVSNIEDRYQQLIKQLFDKISKQEVKYSGINSIVSNDNFNAKETLKELIKVIETKSIFELLNSSKSIKTGNTSIVLSIDSNKLKDLATINKQIEHTGSKRQVTVIGPKNQDYKKAIALLDALEESINKW